MWKTNTRLSLWQLNWKPCLQTLQSISLRKLIALNSQKRNGPRLAYKLSKKPQDSRAYLYRIGPKTATIQEHLISSNRKPLSIDLIKFPMKIPSLQRWEFPPKINIDTRSLTRWRAFNVRSLLFWECLWSGDVNHAFTTNHCSSDELQIPITARNFRQFWRSFTKPSWHLIMARV